MLKKKQINEFENDLHTHKRDDRKIREKHRTEIVKTTERKLHAENVFHFNFLFFPVFIFKNLEISIFGQRKHKIAMEGQFKLLNAVVSFILEYFNVCGFFLKFGRFLAISKSIHTYPVMSKSERRRLFLQ